MEFKLDEVVIYKDLEWIIKEIIPTPNGKEYWLEYPIGCGAGIYASYDDLIEDMDISNMDISTKCECGAKHTSFPTMHSNWCPKGDNR